MGKGHAFGRICNQVAGHKGVFHAGMPHGNPVADCNGREHHRDAPCFCYPKLHGIYNFVKVHMPGDNLIVGAYNPN